MQQVVDISRCYTCVLQSENVRWAHSVAQYREQEETLSGDVLLTAAFISYAGSFSKKYRRELLESLWMPFLRNQRVFMLLILYFLQNCPQQSVLNARHLLYTYTVTFHFILLISPSHPFIRHQSP